MKPYKHKISSIHNASDHAARDAANIADFCFFAFFLEILLFPTFNKTQSAFKEQKTFVAILSCRTTLKEVLTWLNWLFLFRTSWPDRWTPQWTISLVHDRRSATSGKTLLKCVKRLQHRKALFQVHLVIPIVHESKHYCACCFNVHLKILC